ncbi:MAG: UDP-N-acetylmuramoyl-L-alanyl-D-glutamate--2,6-diaminopimelate ligase [Actinobacteria bacterium]|nr:UDP-N-acetylmuramoyl-L-alanyl-D-glutamate--2,6-diaminopimelate ligase [Actinomycetota bacterium]
MASLGEVLARVDASEVARGDFRVSGATNVDISDVTHDSRTVQRGSLFCCVPGEQRDGHDFAVEAAQAGATALLVEREVPGAHVTQVVVRDVRRSMGYVSAAFHQHPSRALTVVGVTGTNGKTTTAQMLGAILSQSGKRTSVFGTLTGTRTTPEAPELQRTLAHERAKGTTAVVMEVSSHALALQRVAGMHFAAKASLFSSTYTTLAVLNRDDAYGRKIADSTDVDVVTFGRDDASAVTVDASQAQFTWRGAQVRYGIGGDFNVLNALAAATAAASLGISVTDVVSGLAAVGRIAGRFDNVNAGGDFAVIVDYAHTPEALRNVLSSARALLGTGSGRVTVVFGCGGDRDPSKRAEMGAAAVAADSIIITSDNPRHESPQAIIDAIVGGIPDSERARVLVEVDRRRAIGRAIADARRGDVVIIAGRGHETMQSVAGREVPFDDAVVAHEVLGAAS